MEEGLHDIEVSLLGSICESCTSRTKLGIQVGQLAPRSIVLRDLHVMVSAFLTHQLNQHISILSPCTQTILQLESESSQIDASLHHPAQSPEVVLAGVDMLVEGRRHQALVRLHQVGPRLPVSQGAIELKAGCHREAGDGALVDRLGQPGLHQLALL